MIQEHEDFSMQNGYEEYDIVGDSTKMLVLVETMKERCQDLQYNGHYDLGCWLLRYQDFLTEVQKATATKKLLALITINYSSFTFDDTGHSTQILLQNRTFDAQIILEGGKLQDYKQLGYKSLLVYPDTKIQQDPLTGFATAPLRIVKGSNIKGIYFGYD